MEGVNGDAEVDRGGLPVLSPLTGCYLLVVIGEPHNHNHKDVILKRIEKGLLSWDCNHCHVDIEKELSIITEQCPEGEEAKYGERLIQYASENLVTEVLIHPAVSTLIQCMKNLLSSFTRHRHIIHSGYTFAGNGSWILQDGTFSYADFSEAFQEIEVQRVLKAYNNTISLDLHCSPEGDWVKLPKESFTRNCKLRLNPDDVLNSGNIAITNFLSYLSPFINPTEIERVLENSDIVGNIRFSYPTLYIFPAGQGDAALFGINGFNMLVDGGFSRKSCFWNFVRHLDRLDAVLLTRINNNNIGGIGSMLRRKKQSSAYPQVGHFFCNIQERKSTLSPDGDKDKDPLLINLFDEGHEMIENLRHINLTPQSCYRDVEPINLYHKVGHGTLDMYVLNPARDSKEVRDFLQKWNSNDQKLFAGQKYSREVTFPVPNLVSVCAVLVWQPANINDNITRILFPGSAPQHKVLEGLDRLKQLEFFKYPTCSLKSLAPVPKTKQSKGSIIEKILQEQKLDRVEKQKEKMAQQNDKVEAKGEERVDTNGEQKKLIKKHDSTESERSLSKSIENRKTEEINGKVHGPEDKSVPKSKQKQEVKPKVETKTKIDAKPPQTKPQQARKPKPLIPDRKPSPKKTAEPKENGEVKEKEVITKPRVVHKASQPTAPAKSAKEANNRKVAESKKGTPPKDTHKQEKKDVPERKPISRRPKGVSVSAKIPGSPQKKLDRKLKLEKEGTTDSSTVSTPSADQEMKKDISKLTAEEVEQLNARELADLQEEQEVIKEIEAVFLNSEKEKRDGRVSGTIKNISIEEGTDEDYLIIEKEEIETQKYILESEQTEKESEHIKENKEEGDLTTGEKIDSKGEEKVDLEKESLDKKVEDDKETQPEEKFSTPIESGATTAPTLPEDERMPLEEIKEAVIEEKYTKEETKEKDKPVEAGSVKKTVDSVIKPTVVTSIKLDRQAHIRDVVKTPDEVADLPVHEEADFVGFGEFPEKGVEEKHKEEDKKKIETSDKEDDKDRETIDKKEGEQVLKAEEHKEEKTKGIEKDETDLVIKDATLEEKDESKVKDIKTVSKEEKTNELKKSEDQKQEEKVEDIQTKDNRIEEAMKIETKEEEIKAKLDTEKKIIEEEIKEIKDLDKKEEKHDHGEKTTALKIEETISHDKEEVIDKETKTDEIEKKINEIEIKDDKINEKSDIKKQEVADDKTKADEKDLKTKEDKIPKESLVEDHQLSKDKIEEEQDAKEKEINENEQKLEMKMEKDEFHGKISVVDSKLGKKEKSDMREDIQETTLQQITTPDIKDLGDEKEKQSDIDKTEDKHEKTELKDAEKSKETNKLQTIELQEEVKIDETKQKNVILEEKISSKAEEKQEKDEKTGDSHEVVFGKDDGQGKISVEKIELKVDSKEKTEEIKEITKDDKGKTMESVDGIKSDHGKEEQQVEIKDKLSEKTNADNAEIKKDLVSSDVILNEKETKDFKPHDNAQEKIEKKVEIEKISTTTETNLLLTDKDKHEDQLQDKKDDLINIAKEKTPELVEEKKSIETHETDDKIEVKEKDAQINILDKKITDDEKKTSLNEDESKDIVEVQKSSPTLIEDLTIKEEAETKVESKKSEEKLDIIKPEVEETKEKSDSRRSSITPEEKQIKEREDAICSPALPEIIEKEKTESKEELHSRKTSILVEEEHKEELGVKFDKDKIETTEIEDEKEAQTKDIDSKKSPLADEGKNKDESGIREDETNRKSSLQQQEFEDNQLAEITQLDSRNSSVIVEGKPEEKPVIKETEVEKPIDSRKSSVVIENKDKDRAGIIKEENKGESSLVTKEIEVEKPADQQQLDSRKSSLAVEDKLIEESAIKEDENNRKSSVVTNKIEDEKPAEKEQLDSRKPSLIVEEQKKEESITKEDEAKRKSSIVTIELEEEKKAEKQHLDSRKSSLIVEEKQKEEPITKEDENKRKSSVVTKEIEEEKRAEKQQLDSRKSSLIVEEKQKEEPLKKEDENKRMSSVVTKEIEEEKTAEKQHLDSRKSSLIVEEKQKEEPITKEDENKRKSSVVTIGIEEEKTVEKQHSDSRKSSLIVEEKQKEEPKTKEDENKRKSSVVTIGIEEEKTAEKQHLDSRKSSLIVEEKQKEEPITKEDENKRKSSVVTIGIEEEKTAEKQHSDSRKSSLIVEEKQKEEPKTKEDENKRKSSVVTIGIEEEKTAEKQQLHSRKSSLIVEEKQKEEPITKEDENKRKSSVVTKEIEEEKTAEKQHLDSRKSSLIVEEKQKEEPITKEDENKRKSSVVTKEIEEEKRAEKQQLDSRKSSLTVEEQKKEESITKEDEAKRKSSIVTKELEEEKPQLDSRKSSLAVEDKFEDESVITKDDDKGKSSLVSEEIDEEKQAEKNTIDSRKSSVTVEENEKEKLSIEGDKDKTHKIIETHKYDDQDKIISDNKDDVEKTQIKEEQKLKEVEKDKQELQDNVDSVIIKKETIKTEEIKKEFPEKVIVTDGEGKQTPEDGKNQIILGEKDENLDSDKTISKPDDNKISDEKIIEKHESIDDKTKEKLITAKDEIESDKKHELSTFEKKEQIMKDIKEETKGLNEKDAIISGESKEKQLAEGEKKTLTEVDEQLQEKEKKTEKEIDRKVTEISIELEKDKKEISQSKDVEKIETSVIEPISVLEPNKTVIAETANKDDVGQKVEASVSIDTKAGKIDGETIRKEVPEPDEKIKTNQEKELPSTIIEKETIKTDTEPDKTKDSKQEEKEHKINEKEVKLTNELGTIERLEDLSKAEVVAGKLKEEEKHKDLKTETKNLEEKGELEQKPVDIVDKTESDKTIQIDETKESSKTEDRIIEETSLAEEIANANKSLTEIQSRKSKPEVSATATTIVPDSVVEYATPEFKPPQGDYKEPDDSVQMKERKKDLDEITKVDGQLQEMRRASAYAQEEEHVMDPLNVDTVKFLDETIDKQHLGQKSPKEREEDVIKIVASVAKVLKSDAPLEEFRGKIPLEIDINSGEEFITELRETHITGPPLSQTPEDETKSKQIITGEIKIDGKFEDISQDKVESGKEVKHLDGEATKLKETSPQKTDSVPQEKRKSVVECLVEGIGKIASDLEKKFEPKERKDSLTTDTKDYKEISSKIGEEKSTSSTIESKLFEKSEDKKEESKDIKTSEISSKISSELTNIQDNLKAVNEKLESKTESFVEEVEKIVTDIGHKLEDTMLGVNGKKHDQDVKDAKLGGKVKEEIDHKQSDDSTKLDKEFLSKVSDTPQTLQDNIKQGNESILHTQIKVVTENIETKDLQNGFEVHHDTISQKSENSSHVKHISEKVLEDVEKMVSDTKTFMEKTTSKLQQTVTEASDTLKEESKEIKEELKSINESTSTKSHETFSKVGEHLETVSSLDVTELKGVVGAFLESERAEVKKEDTVTEKVTTTVTSQNDTLSWSGKSTPDIAEVETSKDVKKSLGATTPPTVPVSPVIKDAATTQDLEDSDLSSSQYSKMMWESNKQVLSDDEDLPGTPLSTTSQVAASSSSHDLEDDSVKLMSKFDPMSTSLYGALPEDAKSSRVLDEADIDFDKAMRDHKEARGGDLFGSSSPIHVYEATTARYAVLSDSGVKKQDLMMSSFIGELPQESGSSTESVQDKSDIVKSWGKPLGLPSPAPLNDNKGTPKKERKIPPNVLAKNKLNEDKRVTDSKKNKKYTPVYVDLTYVPHFGNGNYCALDYFRRIRARYYVFSGLEPSKEVYNALLEAKQTWEDKELEVTIIPTYDTDVLGYWAAENEDLLAKYKIDFSPSASRCTINLQDHETSCSAYRLEFS